MTLRVTMRYVSLCKSDSFVATDEKRGSLDDEIFMHLPHVTS